MKNSGKNCMWPLSFIANNQNSICAILQLRYVQHIWAKIHSLPEKLVYILKLIYPCIFVRFPWYHVIFYDKNCLSKLFFTDQKSEILFAFGFLLIRFVYTHPNMVKKQKASKDGLLRKEFLKKGLVICLFWFMRLTGLRVRF